jgi:hypothetical protein
MGTRTVDTLLLSLTAPPVSYTPAVQPLIYELARDALIKQKGYQILSTTASSIVSSHVISARHF